jgi:hypothetical protein
MTQKPRIDGAFCCLDARLVVTAECIVAIDQAMPIAMVKACQCPRFATP